MVYMIILCLYGGDFLTVYIDVLFAVNFSVNCSLLIITGKIIKYPLSKLRIFISSFLGAVYACFMFFPQIKMIYSISAKLCMSAIIISCAFSFSKWRAFFKTLFVFYLSSFIFGGITLGLFYFTNVGVKYGGALNNGIFYFNFPWKVLFLSVLVSYLIVKIGFKSYKKSKNILYEQVKISFLNEKISLTALVDSGNMLSDPISNTPVIVAELSGIKSILPKEITDFFDGENDENTAFDYLSNLSSDVLIKSRIRMIPFSSLGTKNGMLIGFKPDFVVVQKKIYNDICIGIYTQKLSNSSYYNALISPELINT